MPRYGSFRNTTSLEVGAVWGGGGQVWRDGAGHARFRAAPFEAVAVSDQLQHVDVAGDAIEQDAGEAFGAEDLGPFLEGQLACDQRLGALVALADGLEEQLGPSFR